MSAWLWRQEVARAGRYERELIRAMYASVVIPTFNRRSSLERTLNGLLSQTIPGTAFEIIVVDDCSSDDTEEIIRRYAISVPNLTYIRHAANQGRAVSRNEGIASARGEIVVLLDDDNVPEVDFVEAHTRFHAFDPEQHIAVMGNVGFAAESVARSNFARYLESRYLGHRSPRDALMLDYSNLPPRCFGALNCSIRRADLMAVGMFDTSFRYYGGEDEYLGYCLSRHGVRLVFGKQARSVHYEDLSIERYKRKITETASTGYRVILAKAAEYFEGTRVRFLLPVDRRRDSWRRIVGKVGLAIVLNPLTVLLLERWAILTDRRPWFYCAPLYRLLTAGWTLLGLRSSRQQSGLVTYGKSAT